MRWDRLKNWNCPTCNGFLKENAKQTGYKCNCGFFVSKGKFEAIVNKMYNPRANIPDLDKNLSELNNL